VGKPDVGGNPRVLGETQYVEELRSEKDVHFATEPKKISSPPPTPI
jgi:hypothetical protein